MKAKESKRMTSTASRINRHHVASLFWTLVAVDFVILLTILLTWAYMAEKAALGDAWAANMHRRAEWTEGLSFFDTLRSVVYRFSLPEGEPFHLEAGSFLIMVTRAGLACLGFEALTLVHRWRSGRQRMLSQRMGKAWLSIAQGVEPESAKRVLDTSLALFDRQLVELKAFAPTPDIRDTYNKLEAAWSDYKAMLVGSAPGRPRHTGHTRVLGSPP